MDEHASSPDFIEIETPEHVVFHFEVAGLMSRAVAAALDHGIQFAALFAVVLSVLIVYGGRPNEVPLAVWGALMVAQFLLIWGYFLLFEIAWRGQTPGKRLVGIRVIRDGGYSLTPSAALVRNLIRVIGDFGPLYPFGMISMFANRRAKRLGDFVAGTLVVRESARPLPAPRPAERPGAISPARVNELRRAGVHRLAPDVLAAVESFLARRAGMEPAARAALAWTLAAPIAGALRLEAGPPEGFLAHVGVAMREGRP
jgi:uncharacterized RDD family membrane protein YckC